MPNDYFNPPNSIWPNGLKKDDDYVTFYTLGTNKVDISTVDWPKGDTLISPFVYQNDKLVGFVDTKALTVSESSIIYLPYKDIRVEFSSIDKDTLQIHAPNATTKKASWKDSGVEDIPEAQFKYKGCKTIDNVKTVDANYQTTDIVDGVWSEPLWDLEQGNINEKLDGGMFYLNWKLYSFTSDLSSLRDGANMFYMCYNLTSFTSDLSSLTNGECMFVECSKLTSFTSDLSSLTNGTGMFSGCSQLTSFSSDSNGSPMNLSNLKVGLNMFAWCENLTSFTSDLSSLTDGNGMFNKCKLDAPSVKNIIDTINTYSGKLTLGMGCNDTSEDKELFAQEVGYIDMTSLLSALQSKGWTVEAQYNGRPTTTYGLRRPSENILPVFVKLEEVEEHADYTSEDGSKKFRLVWFHETTGSTDGYTQFNTIEEAIESLNIKPIEN